MGISTGLFKDLKAASSIVSIREIIFPNPDNHEKYTKGYKLFNNIYTNLLSCYSEHCKLHKENVYSKAEKIENM